MGGSHSSEEVKTVDSSGAVNNNIVFTDPVRISNKEIVTLLLVIAIIKVLELAFFVYREHKKTLKKKYAANPS